MKVSFTKFNTITKKITKLKSYDGWSPIYDVVCFKKSPKSKKYILIIRFQKHGTADYFDLEMQLTNYDIGFISKSLKDLIYVNADKKIKKQLKINDIQTNLKNVKRS